MGWYKVKIRTADKYFSQFIRKRDGGCVYKFKCYGEYKDIKELQCSHWKKRRAEGTRYDPDNCDATCKACHNFIENHPDGSKTLDAFKLKQLGQQRYNAVLVKANGYCKRDDVIATMYAKQLLKALE